MILGIDVGTTNVKCVVYDSKNSVVVFEDALAHHASSNVDVKREQDVVKIVNALQDVAGNIPISVRQSVCKVSICGQMHGVSLWNANSWQFDTDSGRFVLSGDNIYNLITWEDARCDSEFLQRIPKSCFGSVSSGFGCASLCWLAENSANTLKKYHCAGTIMDFVVCVLTGNPLVATSTQLANSWGYFDCFTNQWEKEVFAGKFSTVQQFLPTIVEPGTVVGSLAYPWLGISSNAKIYVALGDFQCSVFAAEKRQTMPVASNVVFNFGTGCQLAFPIPNEIPPFDIKKCKGLSIWPYFKNEKPAAVAASLNGGNVLSCFVTFIQDFLTSLGMTPPTEDDIWSIIRAVEFDYSNAFNVSPLLFGERHFPEATLTLSNITASSRFTMANLVSSISLGLVQNAVSFYPSNFFESLTDAKVICVGKAFRLPAMQGAVKRCFPNIPVEYVEEVNSALGAALSVQ